MEDRGIGRNVARRILAGPDCIHSSPAHIAVDRFELAIALDRLLHLRRLPVEWLRCRSRLGLGEEALRLASALQRTYRSGTIAYRQGLAGRNHRKISRHQPPTVELSRLTDPGPGDPFTAI
jgi:hypothetical protein